MAMTLKLRVGSTSAQDVSLTSSGVLVSGYVMKTPDIDQVTIPNLGDGNSLGVPSWKNVTETISLFISDTTAALVAAKVQAIEALLDLARQGSLGQFDDRLYLLVWHDSDSEDWRSQILAAKLEVEGGTNQIWKKYVRADLIVTRRFYWETEAEHALAMTSATTTSATTGYVTVYNDDDAHATNRNWFQIAAAQITGSIPSPAKIHIKNTSGATRRAAAVYLGNYVFCDPTNVDPIYRSADAATSDTTPGDTEQNIYVWNLTSTGLVGDFKGQFGRFVVVWSNIPAITTLVRASVMYFGTPEVNLALGEQMLGADSWFTMDLGALPIPPSGWASGMGEDIALVLKAKAASGTDTLGVDWLQIFPSGDGRYRVLNAIVGSVTCGSNEEIVDDGPGEAVYKLTTSPSMLPIYNGLFEPIYLWPNRINRLRMIVSAGAFSFEAGETWGVVMSHHPRRLSF